jgi:hypothetical protein
MGGVMLLALSSAVARSLEKDEALWSSVADACSPPLRREIFGTNDYPVGESRNSLSEACHHLGLRNQLNLPGKHRYWRTVLLQFGFSAKVGMERLPFWLTGYGVPETVRELLTEGRANSSLRFQELWKDLERWGRSGRDPAVEDRLQSNPWYPWESHAKLCAGLSAGRHQTSHPSPRAEDEDDSLSLFAPPRLRDETIDLALSHHIPLEIANSSTPVLRVFVEGLGSRALVRDANGKRKIGDGSFRVGIYDALEKPVREIRVFGTTGVIYQERFAIWEEEDVTLFRGRSGIRVRDLASFVPDVGCPYALIARSYVQLDSASGRIDYTERSNDLCLYRFPRGLPKGLSALVEGVVVWSLTDARNFLRSTMPGASLVVRELSATRLNLALHLPTPWMAERFRFAGNLFTGNSGALACSPAFPYLRKSAQAVVTQSGESRFVEISATKRGPTAPGAAFQRSDGIWSEVNCDEPLDAGALQGRTMAIRWDVHRADDPWLTLGDQPLRPDPHISRRQRITAMGEPLQLRFGLMNEDFTARLSLAPAVYSSGLLVRARETVDLCQLDLREAAEIADELRIWVWERGCTAPRLIPRDEVEADRAKTTLSILKLSVRDPIGWALALGGHWQGARFHAEFRSENWASIFNAWSQLLASGENWQRLAATLRWWRFPVLMEPFKSIAKDQILRHPVSTIRAWTESQSIDHMCLIGTEDHYVSPLRNLLWSYKPTLRDCVELWSVQESDVLDCFSRGEISIASSLLMRSHPVLLARIVCELLWDKETKEEAQIPLVYRGALYKREPDPAALRRSEMKYRQLFDIAISFAQRHAACGEELRMEALDQLRSWSDSSPLDDRYFQNNILKSADELFEQPMSDTTRLKVAVARSPACCAYIFCHLLTKHGIRDRL